MQSEKRFLRAAFQRPAGFGEPHVRRERRELHLRVDAAFLIEHCLAEAVETESAAAFPVHGFGDTALFALDDLLQARHAMGDRVLAEFNADIASAHFVGDGGAGAGAYEAIEYKIT